MSKSWLEKQELPLPTLNENDREVFGVGPCPFDRTLNPFSWSTVKAKKPIELDNLRLLLDGSWDVEEAPTHGISETRTLFSEERWNDSFKANIPCTIQTALFEAGKIEDPMLLKNNLDIEWVAEREWWLKRKFAVPSNWKGKNIHLHFDGVDYRATFWLNSMRLGQHEGMFGGPDYDVSNLLYYGGKENVLIVSLDPAPPNYEDTFKNNVAYGWHYVKLITLGIWRSVRLEARNGAALEYPFLRTAKLKDNGTVAVIDLCLDIWKWGEDSGSYTVELSLSPKNFDGSSYQATIPITLEPGKNQLGFMSEMVNANLWWPVDMGAPNLYLFQCVLKKDNEIIDYYESNFGIRTIKLIPSADGPKPHIYNSQFVVNEQSIWVKGANWCFPDALLRLNRRRQERFLRIAKDSHVQYIRVWGGGPIENDILYNICDELGIMVQQEFSMLGYHRLENIPSIHATDMTGYMVPRLRNHPSLVVWCGANEISGEGRIVEVLGRRCLELDGTRDFWRTDPYVGKFHWYGVYWEDRPLLDYRKVVDGRLKAWEPTGLTKKPIAFTEFGLSSPASMQTWKHILPEKELANWPPEDNSVLVHHTPTFNYQHINKMIRYSRDFLEPKSLSDMVFAMQISQGQGMKMLIESMRSRKPKTTQTTFYKLTENYPAASWATIDYYGIPKLSQYFIKQAYVPIHVMAIYDDWNAKNGVLSISVSAVNDARSSVSGLIKTTFYDASLQPIREEDFSIEVPTDRAVKVSDMTLSLPKVNASPMFLCLDLVDSTGKRIDRDWSYYNFTGHQSSLFNRPQTSLKTKLSTSKNDKILLEIRNSGTFPAFGIILDLQEASNTYYADKMMLWLSPEESETIQIKKVSSADGTDHKLKEIILSAWNVAPKTIML